MPEQQVEDPFAAHETIKPCRNYPKVSDINVRDVNMPVFVSPTLWRGLLWPYPSATTRDYAQLLPLEEHLGRNAYLLHMPQPPLLMYLATYPKWLNLELQIKVQPIYAQSSLSHFLLLLPDESPQQVSTPPHDLLPLGLLASLFRCLNGLQRVARTTDDSAIEGMFSIARDLADAHPLTTYFRLDAADLKPPLPDYLSRLEYRTLVLRELERLLEIVAALDQTIRTSHLKAYYWTLFDAPKELLDILETLVALSAQCPNCLAANSPYQRNLICYYHTCNQINQGLRKPTSRLMKHVLYNVQFLATCLPYHFMEELEQVQVRLADLQRRESPCRLHPASQPSVPSYWH